MTAISAVSNGVYKVYYQSPLQAATAKNEVATTQDTENPKWLRLRSQENRHVPAGPLAQASHQSETLCPPANRFEPAMMR